MGESQRKTLELLALAQGKVLVIDEAYNLDDDKYGKQVLDILVEKIQATGTDDIAVLLLGYEKPMLSMLRDQNPGLARRFPREYAFVFDDYTSLELLQLFYYACQKHGVVSSESAAEKVLDILSKQRLLSNFGNAGAVNSLVQHALSKASLRDYADGVVHLEADDFDSMESTSPLGPDADPLMALDGLFRLGHIKEQLASLRDAFQVAQAEGSKIPDTGHFVFRGSPGTGKTTVARAMARILHQLGLLACAHVEETSGLDLTGQYVGQTKTKVEEKLKAAKGGVLFVDEAYELGQGPYGKEAMTSLVAAMTDPTYKGLVVIVAGYPRDMDAMLNLNAGLKSRFTRFFDFPDWHLCDCMDFITLQIQKENFETTLEVKIAMEEALEVLRVLPGWGNGRDVLAFWQGILDCRASRVVHAMETIRSIVMDDVQLAFHAMKQAREVVAPPDEHIDTTVNDAYWNDVSSAPAFSPLLNTAPVEHEEESMLEEEKTEEKKEMERLTTVEWTIDNAERDPGVSNEDWEELEASKRAHQEHLERLKKEMEQEALRKELAKAQLLQEKIRRICPCPAGFSWFPTGGGI